MRLIAHGYLTSKRLDFVQCCEKIHDLIGQEINQCFDSLFEDVSLNTAKQASKEDRATADFKHDTNLTYGEIHFSSFYQVLRKIQCRLPAGDVSMHVEGQAERSTRRKFIDLG
jgi:nitrate/nitrite-specific signal transduction histidine kinase